MAMNSRLSAGQRQLTYLTLVNEARLVAVDNEDQFRSGTWALGLLMTVSLATIVTCAVAGNRKSASKNSWRIKFFYLASHHQRSGALVCGVAA